MFVGQVNNGELSGELSGWRVSKGAMEEGMSMGKCH